MESINKYTISLFGESYTIVSDENEEHLLATSDRLDQMMKDVSRESGITDYRRVAVLAALQLASNVQKLEQQIEDYDSKGQQLVEHIEREMI